MPTRQAPQPQPAATQTELVTAQPNALGLTGWTATLANMSAVAVLCWLVTTEIPRQSDNFRSELKAIRDQDEKRTNMIFENMRANEKVLIGIAEELRHIKAYHKQ